MVVVFYILFLAGGIIAWKLYKGNQWWKLAGYLFLITTAILSFGLFCFVWDWNDNGGCPANIPPDEGSYITANELVGIIMLLWTIFVPILSCEKKKKKKKKKIFKKFNIFFGILELDFVMEACGYSDQNKKYHIKIFVMVLMISVL